MEKILGDEFSESRERRLGEEVVRAFFVQVYGEHENLSPILLATTKLALENRVFSIWLTQSSYRLPILFFPSEVLLGQMIAFPLSG